MPDATRVAPTHLTHLPTSHYWSPIRDGAKAKQKKETCCATAPTVRGRGLEIQKPFFPPSRPDDRTETSSQPVSRAPSSRRRLPRMCCQMGNKSGCRNAQTMVLRRVTLDLPGGRATDGRRRPSDLTDGLGWLRLGWMLEGLGQGLGRDVGLREHRPAHHRPLTELRGGTAAESSTAPTAAKRSKAQQCRRAQKSRERKNTHTVSADFMGGGCREPPFFAFTYSHAPSSLPPSEDLCIAVAIDIWSDMGWTTRPASQAVTPYAVARTQGQHHAIHQQTQPHAQPAHAHPQVQSDSHAPPQTLRPLQTRPPPQTEHFIQTARRDSQTGQPDKTDDCRRRPTAKTFHTTPRKPCPPNRPARPRKSVPRHNGDKPMNEDRVCKRDKPRPLSPQNTNKAREPSPSA